MREDAETAERTEWVLKMLDAHEKPLISFAARILGGDLERAKDVVQETFIKLCRQPLEMIRTEPKSWLYRVCRNAAIDVIRYENRLTYLDEAAWDTMGSVPEETHQDWSEEWGEIERYLLRLPENQRRVLCLKFQNGLNYKEISQITGLSVSNVGFLLHSSLQRMRQMMSHHSSFLS